MTQLGESLGRMLRQRREAQGKTREQVAARLPIEASTVGQIETGEIIRPPDNVLQGFARVLGMSFEKLQRQADRDKGGGNPKPDKPRHMSETLEAYTDDAGNLCLLRELPPGEEPPKRLVLFSAGVNPTTKGDVLFDELAAKDSRAAYEDKGQELLPWDYNHGMLSFIVTPEGSKAAGWFRPEWPDDGSLVANDIEWTPACDKAIRAREFRFYSPAVKLGEGRRVKKLVNSAVCNLPATKGQRPMVASETMPGDTGATKEDTKDTMSTELLKLLGAETEAGAIGVVTQLHAHHAALFNALGVDGIEKLLPAVEKLKATAATATGLAEEVRELTAKLADGEREQLIAQLNDAGKLPEALHDWARTQGVASLRAFGDAAPAHPKYQGSHEQAGADAVVLTDAQKQAAKQLGYTDEEYAEAVLANEKAEADRLSGRAPSTRRAD